MKVFVLVLAVAGFSSSFRSGPYLPSGWKPQGAVFLLPSEVKKTGDNPLKDTILQESEASGSDFLREYGPPKVQEVSQEITNQGLPDVEKEEIFVVLETDLKTNAEKQVNSAVTGSQVSESISKDVEVKKINDEIHRQEDTSEISTIKTEEKKSGDVKDSQLEVSVNKVEKSKETNTVPDDQIIETVNEIKDTYNLIISNESGTHVNHVEEKVNINTVADSEVFKNDNDVKEIEDSVTKNDSVANEQLNNTEVAEEVKQKTNVLAVTEVVELNRVGEMQNTFDVGQVDEIKQLGAVRESTNVTVDNELHVNNFVDENYSVTTASIIEKMEEKSTAVNNNQINKSTEQIGEIKDTNAVVIEAQVVESATEDDTEEKTTMKEELVTVEQITTELAEPVLLKGKYIEIETQTAVEVTSQATTHDVTDVETTEENTEVTEQENKENSESSVVKEKEEKAQLVEEIVKTINVEIKSIADALISLENEVENEIQRTEAVTETKVVQENSGSLEQVPEGFLEYGPPGFREYGPPSQDEILVSAALTQEKLEEESTGSNEIRKRRFSPKARLSRGIH